MNEIEMIRLSAEELGLKAIQVQNTIDLLDDGNTVPFIARYRKEVTGSLDETQIRAVEERMHYLRALEARKETILKSIEEQGKLTPELKNKIQKATKLQEVEDLYLPYKPKKRTRATIAKEKGLEPLAELILKQETISGDPEKIASDFINSEKEVNTIEEAFRGACDIVAETISDDADIRKIVREETFKRGLLQSALKKAEGRSAYEMYYEFSEPLDRIPPHRVLALNRGESEGVLKVGVEVDNERMTALMEQALITNRNSIFNAWLTEALRDSWQRLIAPSIFREVRHTLTEKADSHAIAVFAENLKNLLLQPPLRGKIILGIDPGFRSGCKAAVIDQTGKYLEGNTIYPHAPQKKYFEAKSVIRGMCNKYKVDVIAIGNGTASRETEQMTAEVISEMKEEREVQYIIVSEAGASVYSASKIAQQEFPELDAAMRGNISIARRLLDPLAELVKIDPKSIGVGLYQHDVNQRNLAQSLQQVVESVVNRVGVNLNTASASLLKYVSGFTSRTATSVVEYRDENGAFSNREELKKVAGLGAIAFQQAAGFLRIPHGDDPLDNTAIHPESYRAARTLLKKLAITDVEEEGKLVRKKLQEAQPEPDELLEELGIGEPTFNDILDNLEKPGLDPRDELPKPIFKSEVLKMEDLKEGMVLRGTVRNVVDFGAFVDIGVKQDGLVHVSHMAKKYVKNPTAIVSAGDVVEVKVMKIDLERGRIGLSMLLD